MYPLIYSIVFLCIVCFSFTKEASGLWYHVHDPEVSFIEVQKDFPLENKNLRKWDNPVIADLDRDGFMDLILNDHGLGVSICWNDNGKYSKPYDLIMGDLHGISVGDINKDGTLEMVISRGGGSGSNARNSKLYTIDSNRQFKAFPDLKKPLELMRGRTVKFFDGDNDGDLDLINFAFPDKDKKGQSENYIYDNDGAGEMILKNTLPPSKGDGQKTLITDFDSDGILDLVLYGEGRVKSYKGHGDLSFTDVTEDIFPYEIGQVTSIVEIDYDNDGDFDLYFTRGEDLKSGETFFDSESKVLGLMSKRGKNVFDNLLIGDVLRLENFQSQWPFNDAYYIGETGYEYEFPGETHSGKNIRLVNSNALGFPDEIHDEGGIHIGYIGNREWRIIIDTWSPTTGVIHGVMSYPTPAHGNGLSDILLENQNGKFKDVTKDMNLYQEEHTTGAATADFDNNGYQDLVVIKRGNLIHENESTLFLNKGGNGFVKAKNHNVISSELGAIGLGVEALDYDKDGKMDIILGNERGKWHLYKNSSDIDDEFNSVIIEVGNSGSGKCSALGALVELKSCTTSQVRRIGSTSSPYSQGFDNQVLFGLAQCRQILEVKVTWTNGESTTKQIDPGTRFMTIGE